MQLDGGDRGLATIFFVDIILGPGLTLLVFKQGKKGLKFDMVMIILFQIIALSWGINSVYVSRPALIVFYDGRFSCMTVEDVRPDIIERLSTGKPADLTLAFLRRPDTYTGFLDFSRSAYDAGSSEIYYHTDLFERIDDDSLENISHYQLDVVDAIKENARNVSRSLTLWEKYTEQNPGNENLKYFPIVCRYKQGMAVFDMERAEIIDYVDVLTVNAVSDIKLKHSEEVLKAIEFYKAKQRAMSKQKE